jgi:hypothetical protein
VKPRFRVVSAGHTTTERAALVVARKSSIPYEKLRGSADRRGTKTSVYDAWLDRNFACSDGTLVLGLGQPPQRKGAIDRAIGRHDDTPALWVAVKWDGNVPATRDWIRRKRIKVLHVTGNAPYRLSAEFLRQVLKGE